MADWEMENAGQVNLSEEATRRLLRDLKEVQREPITTVVARPLEGNLSEWHCQLLPDEGPYKGTAFHVTLNFPLDYPNKPPSVHLSTFLSHPNVFSNYICLDMIKEPEVYGQPYRGWSTAYSVQSLLLQLQSFLFAENVDQDYGGAARVNRASDHQIAAAKQQAGAFSCRSCGFRGHAGTEDNFPQNNERAPASAQLQHVAPIPFLYQHAEAPPRSLPSRHVAETPAETLKSQTAANRLCELPTDVLVDILDRLDAPSLTALVRASAYCARVCAERGAWVRRELQCFYSKRSFTEEVLGFGLAIKGMEEPQQCRDVRLYGRCYSYTCQICRAPPQKKVAQRGKWEGVLLMDYLSSGAFFDEQVHKGVWNEKFQWWLPLLLDDQHSARALPLLKGAISALAAKARRECPPREEVLRTPFAPLDALKILPRLMNGMVVSFMKQKESGDKADLHASEKALLGYCQLHHMLLRLAQDYPEIQREVERALTQFRRDPRAREKARTPDLGELLVLLSASEQATWQDLASSFVEEAFDRNVLWTLREHPRLAILEPRDTLSGDRLTTTFAATTVSRRLIMFQVAFLLLVRPPSSSVRDIAAAYSARYGYPRPGLTRELQETWYRVLKVSTWPAFFAQLGLEAPSPLALCTMLREAVLRSDEKGYHSSREFVDRVKRTDRRPQFEPPTYNQMGQDWRGTSPASTPNKCLSVSF